jgi:release factor glutamine methyltransferase
MKIINLLQNSEQSAATKISRLDRELLLLKVLKVPKDFCYSHGEYELTEEQYNDYKKLLQRRLNGEPIAYILGRREFWSLELLVNEHVLIPRQETEILVEVALQMLTPDLKVLADLGTGSGAIALALACERKLWTIVATDISAKALEVAHTNAMRFDLTNINFFCGSWFDVLPKGMQFDAIVSNPPYIKTNDIHLKCREINFEPKLALLAGEDGLSALQHIIALAPTKLKQGGWLMLEHGYDQREEVVKLMRQYGFTAIKIFDDYAGNARVIAGRNDAIIA